MLDIVEKHLGAALFFGEYFADNPSQFEFTRAERKQIIRISKYINEMPEDEMKLISQPPENEEINYSNTVYNKYAMGWFFTKKHVQ